MAIIRLGTWAKSDRNTIHPAINSSVTFLLFVQSVIVLLVQKGQAEYSFLYLDSRFSRAKKNSSKNRICFFFCHFLVCV